MEAVAPSSLCFTGNVLEGSEKATEDNWYGTSFYYDRAIPAASARFPASFVTTESASDAYADVLDHDLCGTVQADNGKYGPSKASPVFELNCQEVLQARLPTTRWRKLEDGLDATNNPGEDHCYLSEQR